MRKAERNWARADKMDEWLRPKTPIDFLMLDITERLSSHIAQNILHGIR